MVADQQRLCGRWQLLATLVATTLLSSPAWADPSWTVSPSARVSAGASMTTGNDKVAAAGDVSGGVRVFAIGTRGPFAQGELGYSYADNQASPHALTVGTGLGYRLGTLGLSISPRLVIGLSESAVGVRTGFTADLVGAAFVELAHQYMAGDVGEAHSLRITAGIDIGLLFYILTAPMETRP